MIYLDFSVHCTERKLCHTVTLPSHATSLPFSQLLSADTYKEPDKNNLDLFFLTTSSCFDLHTFYKNRNSRGSGSQNIQYSLCHGSQLKVSKEKNYLPEVQQNVHLLLLYRLNTTFWTTFLFCTVCILEAFILLYVHLKNKNLWEKRNILFVEPHMWLLTKHPLPTTYSIWGNLYS